MTENNDLIVVENLKKHFRIGSGFFSKRRTVYAVNGLNFTIRREETLGLVGESGCGKSTTGQAILDIACRHRVPVINEIVGVRNWAQAEARCLGGENTRGWYAAEAAIETARVYKQIG